MNNRVYMCRLKQPDVVDLHYHDDASGCRVISTKVPNMPGPIVYMTAEEYEISKDLVLEVIDVMLKIEATGRFETGNINVH